MKKMMTAAIAVLLIAGAGAATAQPGGQRYDDRRDSRSEQRQDRRDDRREDRAERREDRQENRYERRAARRYNAGRYQPPRGYQVRQYRYGQRLPAAYRSRAYVVDHRRYGLNAPPRGYQYVRVGNDVVLTAIATGLITSVIVSMFQ